MSHRPNNRHNNNNNNNNQNRRYTPYNKHNRNNQHTNNQSNKDQPQHAPDQPTHNFRFTSQNETLEDVLKTQTVGLVNLSEFKKRRVELLEAKERELAYREQTSSTPRVTAAGGAGGRSRSGNVNNNDGSGKVEGGKRRRVPVSRGKLSFAAGDDEDEDDEGGYDSSAAATPVAAGTREATPLSANPSSPPPVPDDANTAATVSVSAGMTKKIKANPSLTAPPPTVITKATMRKEAELRQNLRREFNKLQDEIKNEEISIPFVFYDGNNVPGGECKMKKGEAVWLFLERARRTRGLWHRVSVDDLMFVRGEIIIPHHYEFFYFIVNRTLGPHGMLFDYPSALTPAKPGSSTEPTKEKAPDDPTTTKVVDRRWYERNKHIFPASMWEMFDPNKDYTNLVRRDRSDNAFFFT